MNKQDIEALQNLAYAIEGQIDAFRERNFGEADKWVSHVDRALRDFENTTDSSFWEYCENLKKKTTTLI